MTTNISGTMDTTDRGYSTTDDNSNTEVAQLSSPQDTALNGANGTKNAQLAQGLGWFSLGLGLAEVLAPRSVAKIAGLDTKHTALIRMFGLREMTSGVAIFMQRKPAGALWSRVAGDALDLACLGAAFASPASKKGRLAFATASVLGVTAADVFCAKQQGNGSSESLSDKAGVLH
jgi:hypothetical protein